MKWLKRIGYIFLGFIVLSIVGINAATAFFKDTDTEILDELNSSPNAFFEVEYDTLDGEKIRIFAEKAHPTDSTLIVFVHGAPGDWSAWKKFLQDSTMQVSGQLVAYDRPGYGSSSKEAMVSIKDQASILLQLVEKYPQDKVILVGHSYGGPIVGIASILDKEAIDAAVMIAPLNDPESEPIFWVSYFAKWKLTKWLLPKDMRVAGKEKFAHAEALEEVKYLWSEAERPLIHIHGMNDFLAPAEPNIEFSKAMIPPEVLQLVTYEEEGHLILWQKPKVIRSAILKL